MDIKELEEIEIDHYKKIELVLINFQGDMLNEY